MFGEKLTSILLKIACKFGVEAIEESTKIIVEFLKEQEKKYE